MTAFSHQSVLLEETVDLLGVRPGGAYCDGTLGGGGHARAILERSAPDGRLLGLDRDPRALEHCREELAPFGERVTLRQSNFAALAEVLGEEGWPPLDGVVVDLGVSSHQLDTAERGFSFSAPGPLDMRMGPDAPQTAAELIASCSEAELADLIYDLGEERHSRRVARRIKEAEVAGELEDTAALARVVCSAMPRQARSRGGGRSRIHPATRTFQALRIAVNRELEALDHFLDQLFEVLRPGGRVAVIAFHSLEDRRVKQRFARLAKPNSNRKWGATEDEPVKGRLVSRKAVKASDDEIARNPRARSARLRVLELMP